MNYRSSFESALSPVAACATNINQPFMRLYLFLCRLAFIFNLLFFITALMHWTGMENSLPGLFATLLIAYLLCVFLVNPLANLITIILFIAKKKPYLSAPRWLLWTNFFFLIFQFIFIFLLNDPFNN